MLRGNRLQAKRNEIPFAFTHSAFSTGSICTVGIRGGKKKKTEKANSLLAYLLEEKKRKKPRRSSLMERMPNVFVSSYLRFQIIVQKISNLHSVIIADYLSSSQNVSVVPRMTD